MKNDKNKTRGIKKLILEVQKKDSYKSFFEFIASNNKQYVFTTPYLWVLKSYKNNVFIKDIFKKEFVAEMNSFIDYYESDNNKIDEFIEMNYND